MDKLIIEFILWDYNFFENNPIYVSSPSSCEISLCQCGHGNLGVTLDDLDQCGFQNLSNSHYLMTYARNFFGE